jgi:hypothetical protein
MMPFLNNPAIIDSPITPHPIKARCISFDWFAIKALSAFCNFFED